MSIDLGGKVPASHLAWWFVVEAFARDWACGGGSLMSVYSMCWSKPYGIRYRKAALLNTAGFLFFFLRDLNHLPCCLCALWYSFQFEWVPANIGSYCERENFVNVHFFLVPPPPPPCQADSSPEFPALTGGETLWRPCGTVLYGTPLCLLGSLLLNLLFMPNRTSGTLSSLLGSGTEGRKALGGKPRPNTLLWKMNRRQLWIQLYVFFPPSLKCLVFAEQGATSGASRREGNGGSESGNYQVPEANGA